MSWRISVGRAVMRVIETGIRKVMIVKERVLNEEERVKEWWEG